MKNVTLTCIIGVDPLKYDLNLIAHFIKHYRDMGIEKFLIAANAESEERTTEGVRILRELGIEPVLWIGEFFEFTKCNILHQLQKKVKTKWTFVVDSDEFVQISNLKALLHTCEKEGYIAVRGNFVDRIAASNKLEPVKSDVSIWEQFPKEMDVIKLLGGVTEKAFLFKTGQHLSSHGAHGIYDKRSTKFWGKKWLLEDKYYHPIWFRVAHFKWTFTCQVRLSARVTSFLKDSRHSWVGEIKAICKAITGGNLNFEQLDQSKKPIKLDLTKYGYVPGDDKWHKIEIPLADFGNVDFEHISYFISFGSPAKNNNPEDYVPGSSYMIRDVTWVTEDE